MQKIKFNGTWAGSAWSLVNITYYDDANEVVTNTALATQYKLGDGVTAFGDEAFLNCVELVQITIADTITNFGVDCFTGCTGLTDIYVTPSSSLETMKTAMGVNNSGVVSLMKGATNASDTMPANFLTDKNGHFVPVAHADSTFVNEINDEGKSKTLTQKLAEIIATSGVTVEMLTNAINTHNESNTAHAQIRSILDTCVGTPTWDESTYTMTFTTKAGATFSIDIPIEQIALSYNSTDNAIEFVDAQGDTVSIPVIDFIEIYTGSVGDQIQISIGSGNVINATILGNSITIGQLSVGVQELLESIGDKLDASAIADWAKQPEKPVYTATEVNAYSKAETYSRSEVDEKLLETIKVGTKIGDVNIVI